MRLLQMLAIAWLSKCEAVACVAGVNKACRMDCRWSFKRSKTARTKLGSLTVILRSKMLRRSLLMGVVLMGTSGCASMKPPTSWFSKDSQANAATPKSSSGLATTLSNTTKGISGQFKSMGTAVSSAYSKTKDAVTSTFTSASMDKQNGQDPTSLTNMPLKESLGPEIWVTNGQLYESQGNFTKALDNYTKALELEPNSQAALLSTARLYARQNHHPQASEFFSKALAVNPQASIYNELAVSLQGQGKPAEAQAAVRKAIQMDASNPRYRNNLAGMLVRSGRSDEAVKELQQVFPPAVANYNVAYLHVQNKNVAAAQQHLQTALKIDPNLALARDLLNQINGSSAAKSAVAAFETAGNIYRTAEAVAAPNVQANTAVYQMPNQPGVAKPTAGSVTHLPPPSK